MESGSVKTRKRCLAQTLYLKSLCVLKTQESRIVSTLEEATVKREFEEETTKEFPTLRML